MFKGVGTGESQCAAREGLAPFTLGNLDKGIDTVRWKFRCLGLGRSDSAVREASSKATVESRLCSSYSNTDSFSFLLLFLLVFFFFFFVFLTLKSSVYFIFNSGVKF